MNKVNSPVKMQEIVYAVNGSGLADVWIRKNQTETVSVEGGNTGYEADEVCLRVHPDIVSLEEIEADSGFWFDKLKEAEAYTNADHLSVSNFAAERKKELSSACEATIYSGVYVDLPDGSQHFSLTEKDQINLIDRKILLASGVEQVEYHQDGQPCQYYSAEDMGKIIEKALEYVRYQTAYCNSLNMWINGCTKASEIDKIYYGSTIPVEYQSDVLRNYLKQENDQE